MQDPLGMMYCPHCKDKTSQTYTSSSKILCNACSKDKSKPVKGFINLTKGR